MRSFIGPDNWDALTERTRAVFDIVVSIDPDRNIVPWNAQPYIDQNWQEALLGLESEILESELWTRDPLYLVDNENAFQVVPTAGILFQQLLGQQIGKAREVVADNAQIAPIAVSTRRHRSVD